MTTPTPKSSPGNFFEDFRLGQSFRHATPRTVTTGDVALNLALTGSRFPVQSAAGFAGSIGLLGAPLDDLLVFHIAIAKTVPYISVNAVANLGYADLRFETRAYPGDTLSTVSEVIGLRPTSDGKAGIVYVRSLTRNQYDETVVSWNRWVMVRKRNESAATPETHIPDLPSLVPADALTVPAGADFSGYDVEAAGSPHLWEDYEVGERIDHIDGMSIGESEHMMATRLYQNTARVHLDRHLAQGSRFGQPLVYGGHVMSLARALSFNGLANAAFIAAINGGRHAAPSFAGDTIYAWSAVLDRQPLPDRTDVGALRLRTVATKDRPCGDFPGAGGDDPSIVLDLDYWVLIPRQA